jgi:hypothetical protein|tara:strand:- start:2 stop:421 length:420 start_codon:yes stop_codon:yes gene_type:complete
MNYVKRKQQLDHILKDESYWVNDNGYKSFVADMHNKVSKGYSLSEKQETAITNAVKAYAKFFFKKNDPDNEKKTKELIQKIRMVQKLLYECNYERSYEYGAEDFLNSVEKQVKNRGTLSIKQKQALNKMYKRFKKRIEK